MKTTIIVAASACLVMAGCAANGPVMATGASAEARLTSSDQRTLSEQARREMSRTKQADWLSSAGYLALGDEP